MVKLLSMRWMALILVFALAFGMMAPVAAYAAETDTTETIETSETVETVEDTAEAEVEDYATFLACLKILEGYADSYSATSGKDAGELLVNFIRTGVERYNEGLWPQLAGAEITEFTAYVEAQDAANGTNAMLLRNLAEFTIPNGQGVDFGHMFGTMNISYITNTASADLGGWAGDICDLMTYSHNYGTVPSGTVEEMADYIRQNCFGVDADDAFGMDDFYGDMDAFYLNAQMKAGTKLSVAAEGYFTASLTDEDRAAYFLNNRFSGLATQEDVRNAVYDAYASNVGLKVLESDRGLSALADLRTACCYAFADYVYELAADRLEGETGGEEGGETGGEEEGGEEGGETGGEEGGETGNPYYTVFSSTTSSLAPGISQTIHYALAADDKQLAYYVATVDVNRDDVLIFANYKDNDPTGGWGMQRVRDQMAAALESHSDPNSDKYIENFNPILGVNADFYNMSTGKPSGALVMEGVEYSSGSSSNFFAILKDGTPVIGTAAEWATYADRVQEAVGGSVLLVKDGKMLYSSTDAYYTSRASRTCVGITADGQVVLMVLDGRQEPFSAGGSMEEIAQIMLDAGCVIAMNLDGGGSTTFAAKPEGSDTVQLINRPSDGYERSVSSSLMVVSTAKVSNEFDHANITTEYDYLTIGTELELVATGVSASGNAAQIPEGAQWQLSDSTIGSIADGVFTAAANGDVEVTLVLDGTVVGSKTLHVVVPDALTFEKDTLGAVYGVPVELPLLASYKGNAVVFNVNDIVVGLEIESAGTVEGLTFTGNEESGIRTVRAAALLDANDEIIAMITLNLYKDGEAYFDFDNATAGDRVLAWKRVVSNATTTDVNAYHVTDPEQGMDISYTFALDMTQIAIPEQLMDLTYMLPGGDNADATAWGFLLQLAERVSVLTEVKVEAQFAEGLEIDISELNVHNDYFILKNAVVDEQTNTLTITCGWVDQTAAIDPSTANPICILSGLKITPADDAAWDAEDQLNIINKGEVSYNIFLRANALYSFAQDEENQKTYNLIPFENPDVIIGGVPERGASFGATYATFEDSFTLDKTNRQGWESIGDYLYYFVDNVPVTGLQMLPGYEDPDTPHFYMFDEDGSCSSALTGLIDYEGKKYYAIQGAMKTGWRAIFNAEGESDYYYFDPETGAAVDGEQTITGYDYLFEDNILVRGEIVQDSKGYHYIWANGWIMNQWIEVDGNYYFAQYTTGGYFATGMKYVRSMNSSTYYYHVFDDKGVFQIDRSGLYDEGEDTYLLENGIRQDEPGLVYIDGHYYYFSSTGKAVKNCKYWPTKTNGLLPVAEYTFDEYGRIVFDEDQEPETPPTEPETPPTEPETPPTKPETPAKNGIVTEDGALYYYVDGVRTGVGLIQIDGDYYYVRSNGMLALGQYWVTNHNGLLPEGMYAFGQDGKMLSAPVEGKNGLYEESGALYYYVDGVRTYAGLIQIDGDYYYIRSNGQAAVGQYWITKNNDLLPQSMYTFGEDGKMINVPSADKNGIIEENGALYYYVNGVRTAAGLIKLDGDYYYVRSNGQLAVGEYWVTNHNGLLPEGMYTFGQDGKMVNVPDTGKNGIVEEDGALYYYVDGVRNYAGLIEIDGEYYYVRSNGQVAVGEYWVTKTNDLLPQGMYTFGADGKMIQE